MNSGNEIATIGADASMNLGTMNSGKASWSTKIQIPGAFMRLMRRLAVPASESHLTIALVVSLIIMSLLLWGVMWQSGVIAFQQQLIRDLWQGRFGS